MHNSRWSTESSQVLTVPKQLPTPLCFLSLTFHFFNSVLGNTENKVGEGDVQAFLLMILLNTHYIKLDFAHKTLVELEFSQCLVCVCVCVCWSLSNVQLFCNPMDSSLSEPSVHGILQTRILEWVAIPFSRESSWPRDQTLVSCTASRFFTIWAIQVSSVPLLSHVQLCGPIACSTPGFLVHHQLLEFTHLHWVGGAIQPSHPLSSPYPPAFNLSQYQGLFQWVGS